MRLRISHGLVRLEDTYDHIANVDQALVVLATTTSDQSPHMVS